MFLRSNTLKPIKRRLSRFSIPKTLLLSSAGILLTVATAAMATDARSDSNNPMTAKDYRFAGDLEFAIFCRAAIEDDVRLLKIGLAGKIGNVASSRKRVLEAVTSQGGVTCNGKSLRDFSRQQGADNVYTYLVKNGSTTTRQTPQ